MGRSSPDGSPAPPLYGTARNGYRHASRRGAPLILFAFVIRRRRSEAHNTCVFCALVARGPQVPLSAPPQNAIKLANRREGSPKNAINVRRRLARAHSATASSREDAPFARGTASVLGRMASRERERPPYTYYQVAASARTSRSARRTAPPRYRRQSRGRCRRSSPRRGRSQRQSGRCRARPPR